MKANNDFAALRPPRARADGGQEAQESEEGWGQEEMGLLKGLQKIICAP